LEDSHFVPASGTIVEFTSQRGGHTLGLSSSGGGLFGRPTTRKSCGALFNFWDEVSPGGNFPSATKLSRLQKAHPVFALDPFHMNIPGEDQNGFRAIAQRSMLADAVKDGGAVTMFPPMAEEWQRQVQAQNGWKTFHALDFRRLQQEYGVNWVVLQGSGADGLDCPYRNAAVLVCQVK
jgi:hypothetical protein